MSEVVGKGSVEIRKLQVVFTGNLVGALTRTVVPNGDVLNGDAVTVDARLAATDARRLDDAPLQNRTETVR
jgi:hypothetical protein